MVRLSLCGDCVCQAMIEVANQYSPSSNLQWGGRELQKHQF